MERLNKERERLEAVLEVLEPGTEEYLSVQQSITEIATQQDIERRYNDDKKFRKKETLWSKIVSVLGVVLPLAGTVLVTAMNNNSNERQTVEVLKYEETGSVSSMASRQVITNNLRKK